MATLNTACGWASTDPVNLLIALGLGASKYEVTQIITCMNDICDYAPAMVTSIQGLVGEFQDAQTKMTDLNNASNGKTLIKADVLEWAPDKSVGTGYSPEREIGRVRGLLMQYLSSCPICGGGGYNGLTALVHS